MKIVIVRHGMPEPILEGKIPAVEFIDWINNYNASTLSKSSTPNNATLSHAKESSVIVSSSLKRSIDSAKALCREKYLVADSLFIEAGLPSANGKSIKASPSTWAIIFRLLWLCGYSNNSESYKEAKQRAHEATTKLIALAHEHEQLIFVGHGIFNRLIVKELKKRGWSGPKCPGANYWSSAVYEHSHTYQENSADR